MTRRDDGPDSGTTLGDVPQRGAVEAESRVGVVQNVAVPESRAPACAVEFARMDIHIVKGKLILGLATTAATYALAGMTCGVRLARNGLVMEQATLYLFSNPDACPYHSAVADW
jgi:hypothetical protein